MTNEKYRAQDEALFHLVAQMQSGQVENFTEIYNLSAKYIYKIIYDIVQNKDTTEDMLQETYLKIYNNIGSLQNPESFYVWAGRIATNLCIRYREKYRKETLLDTVEDGEGNEEVFFNTVAEDNEMFIPESVMENTEHQRMIAEIIDALSPEQKLAVQCFYFEEMSVKEIAKEMDCSEGTIKSRLNYARKSIKEAVLKIEKEQGTKLYSLGGIPLLFFLFRTSAEATVSEAAVSAGAVRVAKAVCDTANGAVGTAAEVIEAKASSANNATSASNVTNASNVSVASKVTSTSSTSTVMQAAGGVAKAGFTKWILVIIVSVSVCGFGVFASVSGWFSGSSAGSDATESESQDKTTEESSAENNSTENNSSEDNSTEQEKEELDYSEMKSVTLGDMYISYFDSYELSESGTKLPHYGNYYFALNGSYPNNDTPGNSNDPFYYKASDRFLENGELAPIWELNSVYKEESATISKGASERGESQRHTWGKYTALPEEMQDVLTGIIRPIYDQFFVTEEELRANLGHDVECIKEEDEKGRITEYRYYGLQHYFDENGKKVQTDRKDESYTWSFPSTGLAGDKYPVERYHRFTVQTDEGTEYYAIQINEIQAGQSLYTNDYFNYEGITEINKEFVDSYSSYFKIRVIVYRYYPQE